MLLEWFGESVWVIALVFRVVGILAVFQCCRKVTFLF